MTDFDREQATYWFEQSCRRSQLLGSISACVEATHAGASPALNPAKAINRIEQLLAEFHAETTQQRAGTR
jgi:hypothetical protein